MPLPFLRHGTLCKMRSRVNHLGSVWDRQPLTSPLTAETTFAHGGPRTAKPGKVGIEIAGLPEAAGLLFDLDEGH